MPAVLLMFLRGYQMDRITAWLDPWADPVGIGFHSIQGYLALALGGVFGAGLGESRLAGGLFLPNAFNDYIFAIVGEEFGLLGGGLVIVLFLAFGYLGIRTALGAPDTFGALLAAGRHRLDLHPGVHQHRGRRRPHPRHRDPAAVRLRGRILADHQLRGGGHPALGIPRNGRERNLERCAC